MNETDLIFGHFFFPSFFLAIYFSFPCLTAHNLFANLAGRSDWDDGRWEWEETPRRDGHQTPSKRYQPSPSPMLVGVSPDARLVSPWQTPRSGMFSRLIHGLFILLFHIVFLIDIVFNIGEGVYSSWEQPAPSPVPIRASGSSVRSSSSQYEGRSYKERRPSVDPHRSEVWFFELSAVMRFENRLTPFETSLAA